MSHAVIRVARADRASTTNRSATPAMPPPRMVSATMPTSANTKPTTDRLKDFQPTTAPSLIDGS